MRVAIKSLVENIPYPIGSFLAKIPFQFRLGGEYVKFCSLVQAGDVSEDYVVNHFRKIFNYANKNLPFYSRLYQEHGIGHLRIETLADVQKVPIVTKSMIREHLSEFSGAMKLNTGGTSGEPFAFYVDKNVFAREWAHMHKIWSLKKYTYRDIKLTLRGRNLGDKSIVYNPVHNEFVVNTYQPVSCYVNQLIDLVSSKKIHYLHGYPSAIYNFLKELDALGDKNIINTLKKHFQYCLLGSEFPVPYMVQYIKEVWSLDYISWYGHSEMCILAYDEFSDNHYRPFHSYGYAEVVDNHLIGTSYHNADMPLIRYDTGDLAEGRWDESGLLETFTIKEGRNGDFVEDKNGKQIPLTALIFGRHHQVFEFVDCIQVHQIGPGKIEFLLSTRNHLSPEDAESMLDMSNVEMEFTTKIIDKPILTASGKMPLKVQMT